MTGPAARLARYYNDRLAEFGDSAKGAAWPNERDRTTRFDVALEIVDLLAPVEPVVGDLGCGTGELFGRMMSRGMTGGGYVGIDVSEEPVAYARAKFPGIPFHRLDVLSATAVELEAIRCDVLVMNGLFTVKHDLSNAEMWAFMTATLERVWPFVRRGIAFNVMSKAVDRERDDLHHVSYDDLARFLHGLAGRSIGFRADYGLYEYMAYASKVLPSVRRRATPTPTSSVRPIEVEAEAGILPVYRAQLPPANAVSRHLETLDRTRRYSNHGELVCRLESRLSALLDVVPSAVATASSGTAAIVGAILGSAGRARAERPLCLVPAYTFVGTASAIEQCGYRVHLVDVDPLTWSLDPASLAGHPALAAAGLVVPVAPYGRAFSQKAWTDFARRTGVPVVIDAAASFDYVVEHARSFAGPVPVALSLHASKTFSTGEGGIVVCSDTDVTRTIARALNFGFFGERVSHGPSINGKMSEYHAAVGLAELDGWDAKRASFARVHHRYSASAARHGIAEGLIVSPEVAACYVLFDARDTRESELVSRALEAAGIEHRMWYGLGLHREPAFASAERDALPGADDVAARLVGLPVAPDLSDASVDRVVSTLAAALRTSSGR